MRSVALFLLQVIIAQLARCQGGGIGGGGGGGGPSTFGYDASSACSKPYSRAGRARLAHLPCDFRRQNWCTVAGNSYPWHAVRRFVQENQGLMRRMYGDESHISILRAEFEKNDVELKYDDYYPHFDESRRFQYEEDYDFFDSNQNLPKSNDEYEGRAFTSRQFQNPTTKRSGKFPKLSEYTRSHIRSNDFTYATSSTSTSATKSTTATTAGTTFTTGTSTLSSASTSSSTTTSTSTFTPPSASTFTSTIASATSSPYPSTLPPSSTSTSATSASTTAESKKNISNAIGPTTTTTDASTTTTTAKHEIPTVGISINNSSLNLDADKLEKNVTNRLGVTIVQELREQNFSINEITSQVDRIDENLDDSVELPRVPTVDGIIDEEVTLEVEEESTELPILTSTFSEKESIDEELKLAFGEQQEFRPRPEYRPSAKPETANMEGQLYQDVAAKDQQEQPVLKLRGINACPVKEEVVAPFWANNTRGEVLALLNLYPFEQYVHWEKCTHENKQMYCRDGCRCEQQYRLHRLLAYDPNNECRGIFSDWFKFPSCCVCRCYDLPLDFRVTSRSPRTQRQRIKVRPPQNRYV
ncbi:protein spaetzle 4 [Prorops nasuta]|uniref:protein spaetzle 4 n=1 Tax=Prorops nasuta TaxID=863751 RepID=UPI0034CD6A2C